MGANIKYPMQATAIKRDEKVLAIDTQLYLPNENENIPPLEIHSGFSRFVFTIVDTTGKQVITPKANILPKEIDAICTKTNLAMQILFNKKAGLLNTANTEVKTDNKDSDNDIYSGPAYTQKLIMNKYKGKTPAQILTENPNEKDSLINTMNWLKEHLEKFPNNKFQIEAIQNAIDLFGIGELKSNEAKNPSKQNVANNSILIYSSPDGKHFTSKNDKNEKGYSLCYKIIITFNPNMNYPFNVKISNMYAPIETAKNGKKVAKLSMAENTITSNLNIGENEWLYFVNHMKRTLLRFEEMNFQKQYNEATELAKKNFQKN